MEKKLIKTLLGGISVGINKTEGTIPVIFLHGVYFDHNLWKYQAEKIKDRTVVTLDMPYHGNSKQITRRPWSLDDCADMLIEILDALKIDKVLAIGHSWGSMTILRAVHKAPQKFQSVGLCNMPFQAATAKTRFQFNMQHSLLFFRKFYSRQVAKALFGKNSLRENPALLSILRSAMNNLSDTEIRETDRSVIMNAGDAEPLIQTLPVPALALKGKEDYVPASEFIKTTIVDGGHVSPLEVPEAVFNFIEDVIRNK